MSIKEDDAEIDSKLHKIAPSKKSFCYLKRSVQEVCKPFFISVIYWMIFVKAIFENVFLLFAVYS